MISGNVSIALATYNGAQFVEEQLASLSAQLLRPHELVVADDGSADNTVDLIKRFAKTAPFQVVLTQNDRRLGYARNFFKAASQCKGDIIAFCDQDDIWHPEKLRRCCDILMKTSALLVHHNARVVTKNGHPIGQLVDKFSPLVDCRRPWSFSQGFTQVFNRALMDCVAGKEQGFSVMDGSIAHDALFFFIAACLGKVKFIDENLADYRQHGANAFGWSKNISLKRLIRHTIEKRGKLYETCSQQARLRAKALGVATRNAFDAEERNQLATIEMAWKQIERLYTSRVAVYRGDHFCARLRGFINLTRSGGYNSHGGWAFSSSALMKDAVLGCVLGPLIDKHGLEISLPDLDLMYH